MTGPDSQQIGDEGEIAVEHALKTAAFATGRLSPDLGEDLWLELDGRRASAEGSFPYRALVQAKGSRGVQGDTFTYDLEIKHVRRWAAQPLPVFVVGVDLANERFFPKSIDSILAEDLRGQDPLQLKGTTVRVHLPFAPDLSGLLRVSVLEHYRSSQLALAGLDQHLIEQDYFEIVERIPPEPWAKIPIAGWRVIWKSPRRPQHLAAMLTELARQAAPEYAGALLRPAFVVFHIYRSQFDLHRKLATLHVDWVDPAHPKAAAIAKVLGGRPGEFILRPDKDIDAYREVFRARTATAKDYREYAALQGTLLDTITDRLIARGGLLEAWDDAALISSFSEIDGLWNEGPDAPVECAQLEKMLSAHYGAVFDSYFVAKYRRDALPRTTLDRLLGQSLDRMRECRGTWRVFVRP